MELLDLLRTGTSTALTLSEEDSHHLFNVLRLKEGAYLELLGKSSGRVFKAVIATAGKQTTLSVIGLKDQRTQQSKVEYLLFALCKGDTNDWVAEKCVELAVPNLIIWQADHSVVKIKSAQDAEKKLTRWKKICEAAGKQSGNPHITNVNFYRDLRSAAESLSYEPTEKICCSLSPGSTELKELPSAANSFAALVGPEGDFSQKEQVIIGENKFQPVTLGPYTLRAETAAINVICGINALFGHLSQPTC